jgi:DNA polymerase-1
MKRQYDATIREIKRLTGVEIQPWAAASFKKIFDDEQIPYPLTPKTKKPSFTAIFLENCDHPVAEMIVQTRKLDKMIGTFLEGSILERHHNGVIHCNFNQLKGEGGGAVSGRFSSSAPNLQFIPVRTEDGKLLRQIFLPDEGQDFYHLDYSQIEYRLLVHDAAYLKLRGAEAVARQFREDPDVDFHQVVADMTGLPRAAAKTINFGIAYGEGKDKLSRSLGLTIQEAERLLHDYHAKAPFMQPLSQGFMREASARGVVKTLLGRVRRFEAWERYDPVEKKSVITRHRMPGARRAFTHKALNARTQGSAADIMKAAMVAVWKSGVCEVLGPPQLTVHDELDGSVPKSRIGREAVREMKRVMENVVELLVPLKVDADVGKNWGSVERLDDSEPAADRRRRIR